MRTLISAFITFLGLATAATALDCRDETYLANSYTTCTVDLATDDLRLFLYKPDGAPFGQFTSLARELRSSGKTLAFAMNAGMYHEDRSPVGYYVENGKQLQRVIPNAGPGNFGLLPNGVFCIRQNRADVVETRRFAKSKPNCIYATQSGPMLVIDGALHRRFLRNSTSRFIRNGVGTSADGQQAVFVISNTVVSFHEFGSYFRDHLKLPQALYFDGSISRLYASDLGRSDFGFLSLGPIVAVVTKE
jgi:uncharacterized protein YigE (DUF2233 family)